MMNSVVILGFLKRNLLYFTVFFTGACVLVIELSATRVLSPYFGNTIYSVSSIISVILAALSIGYYSGGKLADRHPSKKWFFAIITLSGLLVLAFYGIGQQTLESISSNFSLAWGALTAALLIFFIPAVLLGTLSPYAVKLQSLMTPKVGVGSVSGKVFFWSTVGSIIGSLSTGFLLIPHFGVEQIIVATGAALVLFGGFMLVLFGVTARFLGGLLASFMLLAASGLMANNKQNTNLVYSKDGLYEKITIYDGSVRGRPTRFFQQDRSLSGATFLDTHDVTDLVYDYTDYYKLYELFNPEVRDALVIGGGAYSIPKALLADLPEAHVDVSEIEPSLFDLAQKYFNLETSPRLTNTTKDGRQWLKSSDKNYGLIFSDVYYSFYSVPAHFTTQEFFELAKSKLTENGIFIANMIGDLSRQEPSLIMSEIKTFQAAFPNSYFFAVESPVQTTTQNIMFVGYNSKDRIDTTNPDLLKHKSEVIRSLPSKTIRADRFELTPYPLLSDNYSPVDYLTSKLIARRGFSEADQMGEEMLAIINQQLRYGPRYLTAAGHQKIQHLLNAELSQTTKEVKLQSWEHEATDGAVYNLTNVIGRYNPTKEQRIIVGTHYDSKRYADKDEKDPTAAMPGANDSASGMAVLLEVSRLLTNARTAPDVGVDFVFFDGEEGEENAGVNSGSWKPLGSTYFAQNLGSLYGTKMPDSAVIIDMVCDKDLHISKEAASQRFAPEQVNAFWNLGRIKNPSAFSDSSPREIRDDHTPLNKAGIPSFLVIDIDYPYFHKTSDTLDKCSAKSLETVAQTLYQYIYSL